MVSIKETSIPSVLSLICVFLSIFHPCAAASFDAKSAFGWIDSSCTNHMSRINDAGDDYNKLVQAGLDSVKTGIKPPTKLGQLTLRAYLGLDLAFGIKGKMTQLQQAFVDQKLSLYCDGSAFEWVTKYQEGAEKGQPLVGSRFPNNGAWHTKEGRYNPNAGAVYISGEKTDQRNDFCQDPKGNNAQGVSSINGLTVVLCPDAFKDPIRQTIPTTKQEYMVGLDSLQSTGSILFHEITHCILGTTDMENGYGAVRAIAIASRLDTQSVQTNAENWLYYAMAVYANQNAWVFGIAQDTNAYADTAATKTPAKRQLASPFPSVSLAEPLIRTPLPSPQAPTSSPAEKALPISVIPGAATNLPAPGPSVSISAASNLESPTPSSNTLLSNTPPASGIPPSKPSAEYSPSSSLAPIITPVDNTPFSNPPSGSPVSINPLSGKPPSGKPPSGDPPSGNPPSGKPPSGDPPSGKPPSGSPPSSNPPSSNPPSGNPPSGNPPHGDPPSGNPPSKNPPANNPPTNNNNDNDNNKQKSHSKVDASVTSHSPSTTSSPSSSTSSASSANYNIESAVIYAEGSDTIRFEAITAVIASEAAALTLTGASGSPTPTTLVTSPRTTSPPFATSSELSCMGVENPKYYNGASIVCSCNNGQTYSPMATPSNMAGPCAFTAPPPSPIPSSEMVPDPTPTTTACQAVYFDAAGYHLSPWECLRTCKGLCERYGSDSNDNAMWRCACSPPPPS